MGCRCGRIYVLVREMKKENEEGKGTHECVFPRLSKVDANIHDRATLGLYPCALTNAALLAAPRF